MGHSTSKYRYNEATDWPYVWALRDGSVLDWKVGLNAEQVMEQQRAQIDLPVEITPTRYLGNCQCAHDLQKLQTLNIRRVLNMAGPTATPSAVVDAYAANGIAYKVICAQDEEDYPLMDKHWEEAHAFINQGNNDGNKEKVLVHCVAGHNRSALVVAARVLVTNNDDATTNVIDAVRHLRKQRGNVALQNGGFQEQLVAFARHHNCLGPAPVAQCPPQSNVGEVVKRKNPLDKLAI